MPRRGDSYSDIHEVFSGDGQLLTETMSELIGVPINITGFNSVRVSCGFSSILDHSTSGMSMGLYLSHMFDDGAGSPDLSTSLPVTKYDVIGPVDENGWPKEIVNGGVRQFKTAGGIDVRTLGEAVYAVGYIGERPWIQATIHGYTPGFGAIWGWTKVLLMNKHAGVGTEQYLWARTDF